MTTTNHRQAVNVPLDPRVLARLLGLPASASIIGIERHSNPYRIDVHVHDPRLPAVPDDEPLPIAHLRSVAVHDDDARLVREARWVYGLERVTAGEAARLTNLRDRGMDAEANVLAARLMLNDSDAS